MWTSQARHVFVLPGIDAEIRDVGIEVNRTLDETEERSLSTFWRAMILDGGVGVTGMLYQ